MTTNELLALAQIIKAETVKNKNSGIRIGIAFEEVVKNLQLNENEISELRELVESSENISATISSTSPENPVEKDVWISTKTGIKYTFVDSATPVEF